MMDKKKPEIQSKKSFDFTGCGENLGFVVDTKSNRLISNNTEKENN